MPLQRLAVHLASVDAVLVLLDAELLRRQPDLLVVELFANHLVLLYCVRLILGDLPGFQFLFYVGHPLCDVLIVPLDLGEQLLARRLDPSFIVHFSQSCLKLLDDGLGANDLRRRVVHFFDRIHRLFSELFHLGPLLARLWHFYGLEVPSFVLFWPG